MNAMSSLGLVELPQRTIEHDLVVQQRYVDFSTELLRLALIGISALAYALAKMAFPESAMRPLALSPSVAVLLALALVGFSIAAAGALVHRYASTDSMAWHLQAMRRLLRCTGTESEAERATVQAETRQRLRQFRRARMALVISAAGLGLGTAALASSAALLLW